MQNRRDNLNTVIELNGLKVYRYIMPGIESNMYLIMEGEEALLIDPNTSEEAISFMQQNGVQSLTVLLTHEHYDHISGINLLRESFDIEVMASAVAAEAMSDPHKNTAEYWDILLMNLPPERIEAGRSVANASYSCHADRVFTENMDRLWHKHKIHMQLAPGHSKGGVLIFFDDILFSGDNLVNGAGVICRIPGGNWKTYCEETRPVIEALSDATWIFPGHGEPARLLELRKYINKFGSV